MSERELYGEIKRLHDEVMEAKMQMQNIRKGLFGAMLIAIGALILSVGIIVSRLLV